MSNRKGRIAPNPTRSNHKNDSIPLPAEMRLEQAAEKIAQKYAATGGTGGPLGQATDAAESVICPDGLGYFRHFQYGGIYWQVATDVHEVHGPIYTRWAQLGWERANGALGYPTSDEQGTPDGVGRYNHFQRGSIYWTPSTGAWEVIGAIRDKWAALGWERGTLGYPIAAEQHRPGSTNAYTAFQHGWIYWTPDYGAQEVHTDPARSDPTLPDQLGPFDTGVINFPTGTPVGGSAQVTLHKDGSYNFSGRFHDSGFPSYNVSFVAGIRSASGTLYTFTTNGHLAGRDESGSCDHDWNTSGNNAAIASGWADLAQNSSWTWKVGIDIDLGPLVDDLKQALTVIGQVITFVIAVV